MKPALSKTLLWLACGLLLWGDAAFAQDNFFYYWQRMFYGSFQGKRSLLYSDSAFHGKPTFGDLDGDGDADLLIGKEDGGINRFENVGSAQRPVWRLVAENIAAVVSLKGDDGITKRVSALIRVKGHAAPALVDIDADGDVDLMVGAADGRLVFYRNVGTQVLAAFERETEHFIPTHFGARIVPFFGDVNGDLAPDLLIGNRKGQVFLLLNIGNKKRPAFCAAFPAPDAPPERPPPCRPTPAVIARIFPETHAAPALVDWDRDGDPDLFVGKRNGTIGYYENQGGARKARWLETQTRFLAIDNGGFVAPAFIDTNGDGRVELMAGTNSNNVFLYTNKDTGRPLDVWKVTGNLLNVRRIGDGRTRLILASGDLDGDGDPDLMVGTQAGGLRWLENTGSKKIPAWKVRSKNLFTGSSRVEAAPALGDLDGDGDLDIVVGGGDGRLWLVRNTGSAKAPKWRLDDIQFAGVDVGTSSVPALGDMDKDGDLDLLVGNSRGLVIYFRNDGTKQAPFFNLITTRFGGISVGRNAAPAIFDWNQDKKPDLVIGNRRGRLALTINRNKQDKALRAWRLKTRGWRGFRFKGYSAPLFSDFNGDGKPDLMVGDGEGNARLWLNAGFEKGAVAITRRRNAKGAPGAGPTAVAGSSGATPGLAGGGAPVGAAIRGGAGAAVADLAKLLSGEVDAGPLPPTYVLASRAFGGLKFRGRIVPAFTDLDGDGDQDLVVGTARGKLIHYRNDGTRIAPKWKQVTGSFANYGQGRNAAPLFVDLDGDKRVDLLVVTEDGRVYFFKGGPIGGKPSFTLVSSVMAGVNVRRNAAPAVVPGESGGPPMLLVGQFTGNIAAYESSRESKALVFKRTHRKFMGLDVGVSASPYVDDMDRDGTLDLIVGSDHGNLLNFQKIPPTVKEPWGWRTGPEFLESLKFPAGTAPRLADIDGDGDKDLFLGTEKGSIYFYRNDAEMGEGGAAQ